MHRLVYHNIAGRIVLDLMMVFLPVTLSCSVINPHIATASIVTNRQVNIEKIIDLSGDYTKAAIVGVILLIIEILVIVLCYEKEM